MNVFWGIFFQKPEISSWHLDENSYSSKWISTFFYFVVISGSVTVVSVVVSIVGTMTCICVINVLATLMRRLDSCNTEGSERWQVILYLHNFNAGTLLWITINK
jgi:hypothetical protein